MDLDAVSYRILTSNLRKTRSERNVHTTDTDMTEFIRLVNEAPHLLQNQRME